jgi:hypothetical protein
MSNRSLLAHELFCLHLKSFYGEQPCSPSREATTICASKKKGRKRSLVTRKWRSYQ